MNFPLIIQGGMGAGVSNWILAQAVSKMGHLGVVSGTALDSILVRRLQIGDTGGHVRRALSQFPIPQVTERLIKEFFIPGGKKITEQFKKLPLFNHKPSLYHQALTVAATFAEVFLAKEGHGGKVGINLLDKIRLPNLFALYGAMMAGVDYVLMGAGIPREIPAALDSLSRHEKASLKISVEGAAPEDDFRIEFDPKKISGEPVFAPLKKPNFLAIVSSSTLATALLKKSSGPIDGFVVEGCMAGGHNAPPRSKQTNALGEPVYGKKDEANLEEFRQLGLPFWLAGSFDTPERLEDALRLGAQGVQVGTAFAFCEESGLSDEIKKQLIQKALNGSARVFTDSKASPTGFPFKVADLKDSLSEEHEYAKRLRECNLGYLRHAYKKTDGSLGYRCPAENIRHYLEKGGSKEDTVGRKCLCNSLLANIGLPDIQDNGEPEKPLVTAGDTLRTLSRLVNPSTLSYSAADVIRHLTEGLKCY